MSFIDSLFQKRLVGLDVGVSGIKAVELEGGKRPRLLCYNRVPLPWDAIMPDGEIRERGAVVSALRMLFESSSFSSKKVAVGASGTSIMTKKIVLPKMTEQELSHQLYWEAEQYIPFNLDDVNLDFAILGDADTGGGGERMMDVLLVAAKKDYVHNLTSVVKEAGLVPSVMDLQAFAIGNVFEFNYGHAIDSAPGGVNVILDCGAGTTKVSVVEGDKTTFTRELSQSGTSCTLMVSEQLGVDLQEAERLKLGAVPGSDAERVIQAHNESLADEISRTMDFFSSQSPDSVIQGMYLCGGGSRAVGLLSTFESKFSVPVRYLNPVQNIAGSGRKMNALAVQELSYLGAVAIGLALRTLGDST